jgi:hypothetical protein
MNSTELATLNNPEAIPEEPNELATAEEGAEDDAYALVPSPGPSAPLAPAALTPSNLAEMKELATLAVKSGLLNEAISTPEAAFVIIATGMELGLSPMQSLRGIHVIEGKPVLSADLLVALAKRSPECLYFRLVESSYERATYETRRRGEPRPTVLTWTLEDARRAELAHKRTWKAHPAAMLRARCAAALARAVYPDLLLGVYEEDEGDEIRQSRLPRPVRVSQPAPEVARSAHPPARPQPGREGERSEPRMSPLRDKFLGDVQRATRPTALRFLVKSAANAKRAGSLSESEFQEISAVAKARFDALSGPVIEAETPTPDPDAEVPRDVLS